MKGLTGERKETLKETMNVKVTNSNVTMLNKTCETYFYFMMQLAQIHFKGFSVLFSHNICVLLCFLFLFYFFQANEVMRNSLCTGILLPIM